MEKDTGTEYHCVIRPAGELHVWRWFQITSHQNAKTSYHNRSKSSCRVKAGPVPGDGPERGSWPYTWSFLTITVCRANQCLPASASESSMETLRCQRSVSTTSNHPEVFSILWPLRSNVRKQSRQSSGKLQGSKARFKYTGRGHRWNTLDTYQGVKTEEV